MDNLLRENIIAKRAAIEVENEPAQSVETAPTETPAEEAASLPTEETAPTEQTKFITDDVEQMLCQQIGNEMFAFYEYTAAAAWFKGQGLDGFAAWANKQAGDENTHMKKVLDFLVELGCTPNLPEITGVKAAFGSVQEAVEGIFKREKSVTKNWRIIAKKAIGDSDAGTMDLAQWFVTEQIEEEDGVVTIMQRLTIAGDGAGLLVLDRELGCKFG